MSQKWTWADCGISGSSEETFNYADFEYGVYAFEITDRGDWSAWNRETGMEIPVKEFLEILEKIKK